MRDLAVLTERHLNVKLDELVAGYEAIIDDARAEVIAAIAAAMVQDQRLRDLLSRLPSLAPHDTWSARWQIRRRVTTTLGQLQFAIRQYDRALLQLSEVASRVIAEADAIVAFERSFAEAYDPTYVVMVAEPHILRTMRNLVWGVLPVDLRLHAYEPPGVPPPPLVR